MTLLEPLARHAVEPARTSRPRVRPRWRASAVLSLFWLIAIVVAAFLEAPWYIHRAALFVHLAALIAGFGAVLVADVHGALWLTGRRSLAQLLSVTTTLHAMIWSGLLGLTLSGMLLHPTLTLPRTQIKLVLVLAAGLNGLWVGRLSRRLERHAEATEPGEVNHRLLVSVMASGAISQAAWWGATLIGFLATTSR